MKILVTGDTGFIGKHLVARLLARNFEVLGVSRRHNKPHYDYETMNFDISSGTPQAGKIDSVVHLAADVTGSEKSNAINIEGTRNMLELAKKSCASSFVYASTGAVYGFREKPWRETDEFNELNSHEEYRRTKIETEVLCKEYSKFFNVAVLRYFYPYGPGQSTERLIPGLINKISSDREIELNNSGMPIVNPVFIDDAIDATISAINLRGFETLNIAGNENASILDIVKLIEDLSGKHAKIKYNGKEVANMIGDVTRAKKMLNFHPKTGLREGIIRSMQ